MNTVKVTAPISIDALKKYFVDNTIVYEIDYKNSTLKGKNFLIYLGNLNIPCDLDVEFDDDFLELLKEYFNSKTLVEIQTLEIASMEILFTNRFGLPRTEGKMLSNAQITKFIEENKEIVDHWSKILDSLTLYNMQTVNIVEFEEFTQSYPKDDTDDLTGINFVQLLKYEEFFLFYGKINQEWLTNYTAYFNEYMFKGKNLYSYWGNVNNPMHVLTVGIASGEISKEEYESFYKKDIQES